MSTTLQIQWGDEEVDLRTCVQRFGKKLPILACVKQGDETYVYGDDEGYCFYKDDTFWLTHIVKVERIIAKDCDDRLLSIPVKYHINFHFLGDNGDLGPAELLEYLIEKFEDGDCFIAENNKAVGLSSRGAESLGKLEYKGSYKERFFIGNNINENGKPYEDQEPIVIPFHSNIEICFASGLIGGKPEDFDKFLNNLTQTTKWFQNEKRVEVYSEIGLFDGSIEDFAGVDYDYVKPRNYMTWGDIKRPTVCPDTVETDSLTSSPSYQTKKSPPPPVPKRPLKGGTNKLSAHLPGMMTNQSSTELPIGADNDEDDSQNLDTDYDEDDSQNLYTEVEHDEPPPVLLPHVPRTSTSTKKKKPPQIPHKEKSKETLKQKIINVVKPIVRTTDHVHGKSKDNTGPLSPNPRSPQVIPHKPILLPPVEDEDYEVASGISKLLIKESRPLPEIPKIDNASSPLETGIMVETYEEIDLDDMKRKRPTKNPQSPQFNNVLKEFSTLKAGLNPSADVASSGSFSANVPITVGHVEAQECDKSESAYQSFKDVPISVKGMAVTQVTWCLEQLHLSKYIDQFREEDIDGDMLLALTEEMLKEQFGFSSYDARKLTKFVHDGWRPKKK